MTGKPMSSIHQENMELRPYDVWEPFCPPFLVSLNLLKKSVAMLKIIYNLFDFKLIAIAMVPNKMRVQ